MEIITNQQIRAPRVRLIRESGENVVIGRWDAINEAQKQGLDLIMVADGNPPVCKILDSSKYKYELVKREKAAMKKQRETRMDTKEIKIRPGIAANDFNRLIGRANEFIEDNNRVKVIVEFRGREIQQKNEIGPEMLRRFVEGVTNGVMEGNIAFSERSTMMFLTPNKAVAA